MAAKTVTIEEARRHLDELVEAIGENDELILAKGDKPVAKIIAIPKSSAAKERRTWGGYEGKVRMSEDFTAPLPDEFWFRGSSSTS